jgi:PAS domain S-box-containing protein
MSLDHLCVTGFDGYFIRVNPSWTRTLGWTLEELRARPTMDLVHPEDRAATLASRQRLHVSEPMGPLVNRYLCKDGSYRWFEWRSIANVEQRVVYAAARDVTEQRRSEDALRESKAHEAVLQRQLVFADRMASVGTLAAGAAHEINNPLAYVTANLTTMLEELAVLGATAPAPQLTDLIRLASEARAGAEKIRTIVRGLKTFSRTEERRTVLELPQVLDLAVTMTCNEIETRALLVKDYGPTPLVEADDSRLGQVFINLLVNAAQAIPPGNLESHEIRIVTSTDAAGCAVIEIRDSGPGIPPEILDRVFDPFFTTKPVGIGTGLGLSICHNIVTSLGGTLSATSEPSRGATFQVVLPAAASARPQPSAIAAPAGQAGPRGTVLVLDDEPSIGSSLGRVLRDHDVTVVTAAKDALALLDRGQQFDVILSDLMMPEMSGMEFYDELGRRFPDLLERVVFISGGAFTAGADTFLDRVTNERLEKPFESDTIRAVVRKYVK